MQITTLDLLKIMQNQPRKQNTLLVAIDGCGGAGKSTLASKLAELDASISIVHQDDFYLSTISLDETSDIGANFDWSRLENEILHPLAQNRGGRFQRYDWNTDRLAEWKDIVQGGIVIIEGVYSLRQELLGYYDYKIWLDCPYPLRLLRGIKRDGPAMMEKWKNEWMPMEDRYVTTLKPYSLADIVIDGSGLTANIDSNDLSILRMNKPFE